MSRPLQVTDGHLRRTAVVYARQSSDAQVQHNTGSTELQREGADRAKAYGWGENIEVRDGDLGASADEPGSRQEFNRLVQEMMSGLVGAVFVTDSSRIGRNEVDHAMFLHAGRVGDVLLIVGYQIFDLNDPNSSFTAGLLGLGAVRDNRSRTKFGGEAKRRKAAQGLTPTAPPVGFLRTRDGSLEFHPDDRVQEVIRIVLDKIFEIRSATGLVRYLRESGIQLPRRARGGAVRWVDAALTMVLSILKNPAYAGTYIYGKEAVDRTRPLFKSGQRRVRPVPANEWIVIDNHHRGYIPPHRWAEVQEILAKNRRTLSGPPGRGEALLQQLLVCTVHKMTLVTVYTGRERLPDGSLRRGGKYHCRPGRYAGSHETCCTIRSGRLDTVVEGELFKTLTPPSIEMIRGAAREAQLQHEALTRAREDELRRAERESARLEEEYLRVDRDQPLVKARLAGLWEQAQQRHADLVQRHRLCPLAPPFSLEEGEGTELARLLQDLHALWRHRNVTSQQRKVIVHLLIKAIYVTPGPEVWKLEIEWAGGSRSQHDVLTREGISALVEREHMSGRSVAEIREDLTHRNAVIGVSTNNAEPYRNDAVQQLVRHAHHDHKFDERAYRLIHRRVLEGASYQIIANELKTLAIPHFRGWWTVKLVRSAVYRMRTNSICGLPRLPTPEPLGDHVAALHDRGLDSSQIADRLREAGVVTWSRNPVTMNTIRHVVRRLGRASAPPRPAGSRPLDVALRRLWDETPSISDVTRRANEQGIRTSHGNPWRISGMARKLASLGLRSLVPRGPYRSKKHAGTDEA